MHAWVDGADEVYAGVEEVFCFGRGQDVMSERRVMARGNRCDWMIALVAAVRVWPAEYGCPALSAMNRQSSMPLK